MRDERGAVIVIVAVMLPLLVVFLSFVIDIGTWWVHKRHLQVQADAAALAGVRYIQQFCSDAAVVAEAQKYSGESTGQLNHQLGGTASTRVHMRVNSRLWGGSDDPADNQSTPVDNDFAGNLDPTSSSNPDRPCARKAIDVKMTESDLPWLVNFAQLFGNAVGFDGVQFANTQARLEVRPLATSSGSLPIGVRDSTPKRAKAIFVDESKPESDLTRILGSAELFDTGVTQDGLAVWDNAAGSCDASVTPPRCGAAAVVTTNVPHIGVRIVLSGSDAAGWDDCANPGFFTQCFDAAGENGLRYIRAYPQTDTPGPQPRVRNVSLLGSGTGNAAYCVAGTTPSDGYFLGAASAFSANAGDCDLTVSATLAPGLTAGGTPQLLRDYKLRAHVTWPGLNNPIVVDLTQRGNPNTSTLYENQGGTNRIAVPPESGPVSVTLDWVQTGGTYQGTACPASTCEGQIEGGALVTRGFAPVFERSGPIEKLNVADYATNARIDSVERCATCTRNVYVRVGLAGAIRLSAPTETQGVVLRFGTASGSQNGALDCDPDVTKLEDEIAFGCAPTYQPNTGTTCPDNKADLWALDQPWECIVADTGDKTNQIARGLNQRILGTENPDSNTPCIHPNRWPDLNLDGLPDYTPDDPRILPLFVVPFSSFRSNGNTEKVVPLINFAAFYVTGWKGSGAGATTQCTGTDEVPAREKRAYMVGHYIQYVLPPGAGTGGTGTCDFTGITGCIPVMTK